MTVGLELIRRSEMLIEIEIEIEIQILFKA